MNLCVVEKYQRSMIHALKEVQGDENIVGFYQTTSVPLRPSLVDTQATDYGKLRHGGIVIVHGTVGFFTRTRGIVTRGYIIDVLTLLYRPSASQPWHCVLPRLSTNTKFPNGAQAEKVYDTEVIIYSSTYRRYLLPSFSASSKTNSPFRRSSKSSL